MTDNVREALALAVARFYEEDAIAANATDRALVDAVLSRFDVTPKGQAPADVTEIIGRHSREAWSCGNSSHTNPEVGCPDCGVVCDFCAEPWPCDARRLADALERASQPVTEDQALRDAAYAYEEEQQTYFPKIVSRWLHERADRIEAAREAGR